MKVLVISHAYAAPINRQKVKALSRRPGLSMSLLLPRFWKEGKRVYITEPGEEGFRIFTGNVLFPGRIGGHVYRNGLIRALRTVHPDVIHLEEEPWSLVAAQVMAASAFLKPRPKLVLFSFENLDLNLRRTYRVIERRSLARADVLLAGGQTVRDRLLRRGADPKRVVVLPQFGLDPDFFRLPGPGESPKTFTVGFIGRLVPEKGVDLLIRALSEIEGDWRALIVGDGPNQSEWESLTRSLGLAERFEFAGWVDHHEIPEFLRRIHVLVLPSRTTPTWSEQFGHVLIEAMSSGVVPVGSDSGEIPNVIGEEGLTFPEGDEKALRGAICRLRGEPGLRERLSGAGRERAVREYSWERIADKTHAIYEMAYSREENGNGGGMS